MTAEPTRYYPAFLDLTGRHVIVVGEGRRAERKARQLARYGALVVLITPKPSVDILQSQVEGLIDIESRAYVRGNLEGAALVFVVDADEEVAAAVASEARSVGCPVNVSGSPKLTTFLAPSVIHREPLQIAISTSGATPHLAKHLRVVLSQQFGEEWGAYTMLLAELRALAEARLGSAEAVDATLEAAIASDLLERVRTGDQPTAAGALAEFAPKPETDGDEDRDAAEADRSEEAAPGAGEAAADDGVSGEEAAL